jgi:hypothetical protein
MGRDSLLEKLASTLSMGLETEQAVVYCLVEIRKLADRDNYIDHHLKMFCNWVVHTSLAQRGEGSTLLLKAFDDEIIRARENGKSIGSSALFQFGTFRQSLNSFLTHFALPKETVDVEAKWRTFIMLYSSIISECPLVFTASKLPLKYISSVELLKAPRFTWSINNLLVHRLRWKLIFKDGKEQYVSTVGKWLTVIYPPELPPRHAPPPHSAPQTPTLPPR